MSISSADFVTSRLQARGWHAGSSGGDEGLERVVMRVMSSSVTRALPPQWQGEYTFERAQAWIAERDEEGVTLLVSELASRAAIGLVILSESRVADAPSDVDLRLGYLLVESAWGRGYGTELVAGLVGWARSRVDVRSLAGGVASDNVASSRVLIKNGFQAVSAERDGEQLYELVLRS